MTVDEILATGRYTDRRGRVWAKHTYYHGTVEWMHPLGDGACHINTSPQMRLLIERDKHRATCPGLGWCVYHPVPRVVFGGVDAPWTVIGSGGLDYTEHDLFDDAMDAARALAVGE